MIHFDTEDQKAFILEALAKVTVPLIVAERATAIMKSIEAAHVGESRCAQCKSALPASGPSAGTLARAPRSK